MPLQDLFGGYNQFDAFVFINAEPMIWIPTSVFFVTDLLFNLTAQILNKKSSASHMQIIFCVRGLAVWIL